MAVSVSVWPRGLWSNAAWTDKFVSPRDMQFYVDVLAVLLQGLFHQLNGALDKRLQVFSQSMS